MSTVASDVRRPGPRTRVGVAIDLHARAADAENVGWPAVLRQVLAAERAGLDLVVLPDHLSYRSGERSSYALSDEPVGARESTTFLAALAAATSTIGLGHSVLNGPYRTPAMVAHVAAALAEISGGRYSLGLGAGNSLDYDQLGVDADHRAGRLEELVPTVAALLREGRADLDGTYWRAREADLVLRPRPERAPPLVVAAWGPRTMRVAVQHGDAWNGWCPTNPEDTGTLERLRLLEQTCDALGRDPQSIDRTGDLLVDPLDARGARDRSWATIQRLAELGFDEVRCYPPGGRELTERLEAIEALANLARNL